MLKTPTLSPAQPSRAKTRQFPSFVLGSKQSSTYPTRGESCLGSSGREGGNYDACGSFSPAALLADILSIRMGAFGLQ